VSYLKSGALVTFCDKALVPNVEVSAYSAHQKSGDGVTETVQFYVVIT